LPVEALNIILLGVAKSRFGFRKRAERRKCQLETIHLTSAIFLFWRIYSARCFTPFLQTIGTANG
jgi:hypothetical protein